MTIARGAPSHALPPRRSANNVHFRCHAMVTLRTDPPLSHGHRLGAAGPDPELERPLEKSHAGSCRGRFFLSLSGVDDRRELALRLGLHFPRVRV